MQQNTPPARIKGNFFVGTVAAILIAVVGGAALGLIYSHMNAIFCFFAFLMVGFICAKAFDVLSEHTSPLRFVVLAICMAAIVLMSQVVYIADSPIGANFDSAIRIIRNDTDMSSHITTNIIVGLIAAILGAAAGLVKNEQPAANNATAQPAAQPADQPVQQPAAPASDAPTDASDSAFGS